MCGIYGIGVLKNSSINTAALRSILKELAINSQERGRDATGYAFTTDKGISIVKHAINANGFVSSKNYTDIVKRFISSSSKNKFYSVIGHTRAMTKGSPSNNDNNHPIRVGNIVGVHNGVICNDDSVFNELNIKSKGKVKRIAQVDSEAIFSSVNYFSRIYESPEETDNDELVGGIKNPTSRAISKTAGKLRGSFSCSLVNSRNTKILWLFRANGQLSIKYYEKEGLIIFASIEDYIKNSVTDLGMSTPKNIPLKADQGICINLEKNIYNSFDLNKGVYPSFMHA